MWHGHCRPAVWCPLIVTGRSWCLPQAYIHKSRVLLFNEAASDSKVETDIISIKDLTNVTQVRGHNCVGGVAEALGGGVADFGARALDMLPGQVGVASRIAAAVCMHGQRHPGVRDKAGAHQHAHGDAFLGPPVRAHGGRGRCEPPSACRAPRFCSLLPSRQRPCSRDAILPCGPGIAKYCRGVAAFGDRGDVAVGTFTGEIAVYRGGEIQNPLLTGHSAPICCIESSPDYWASSDNAGTIIAWTNAKEVACTFAGDGYGSCAP